MRYLRPGAPWSSKRTIVASRRSQSAVISIPLHHADGLRSNISPRQQSRLQRRLHTRVPRDLISICSRQLVRRDPKNRPVHLIDEIPAGLGNRTVCLTAGRNSPQIANRDLRGEVPSESKVPDNFCPKFANCTAEFPRKR